MKFQLEAQNGQARAATLETHHGVIQTPTFMPVGTRGTVKTVFQDDLEAMGAQIILGNTYHLYLRPGHELIERLGGLHEFMSWKRPILTDSGGFQIYSLSDLRKIAPEGVHFKSHLDGSSHFIGPEKSMEIQRALGSDIVMCFDECPSLPSTREKLQKSIDLTLAWAKRCREYHLKDHQSLFGIIQGGLELDLRRDCLSALRELDFPGYAVGGLSVGEKNDEMVDFCREFVPGMPSEKPRYLMGVGTPLDLMNGIKNGLDLFDCVLPTRNARNGQFLTWDGPLSIKKERFKEDQLPPDPDCSCRMCQRYSRAYVRHLYLVGEYLSGQIISYHNLFFYLNLMRRAREAIFKQEFDVFYQEFYNRYTSQKWI